MARRIRDTNYIEGEMYGVPRWACIGEMEDVEWEVTGVICFEVEGDSVFVTVVGDDADWTHDLGEFPLSDLMEE